MNQYELLPPHVSSLPKQRRWRDGKRFMLRYEFDTVIPVILSAGRGSRLGSRTNNRPKWFLQLNEKRVCDYQLESLSTYFDQAYIVLGYGFEDSQDAKSETPTDYDIDLEPVYYPDWDKYENAGTLHYTLKQLDNQDEDLLLICGDIIFTSQLLRDILSEYRKEVGPSNLSAVCAFEGHQAAKTAVRWNDNKKITDYGRISGHEEAGIFVLASDRIKQASSILSERKQDWFPIIFPQIETKSIIIDSDSHFEINTPEDLDQAKNRLKEDQL